MNVHFEVVNVSLRKLSNQGDIRYFGGKYVLVAKDRVVCAADNVEAAWEEFFRIERMAERGITMFHEKWDEKWYQYDEACRRRRAR